MSTHLRVALRSLVKSPGFSVVAIVILAVGIGASTAIFSVVHALLLKPLAYREARQLVQVQSQHLEQGVSVFAPATFADLARTNRSFATVAAQQYYYVNLTQSESPARLTEVRGSDNYFELFGVAPLKGRTWSREETRANAAPVVVISETVWRSQFHAREDIVGQVAVLDDVAHTIIGVMPATFTDPWGNASLWRPFAMDSAEIEDRKTRYWAVFARLRDSTSLEEARAEMGAFGAQLAQAYPEIYRDWTIGVEDLQSLVVGDYKRGLLIVLGAVSCVLLITCANVAGLAVVRALARRKEFAIRAAIGGSTRQLLGASLLESLLLALVGGALGVLLANWGVTALLAIVGDGVLPRAGEIALSQPVLLAALALTLFTGFAFGLAPAYAASRVDANEALKDTSGQASAGPGARRLRSSLVVIEIALAVLLLVGAGLLGRSFGAILRQDPGMRTGQLLSLGVSLSSKRYDSAEKRRDFYTRVEQAVAAVPGVKSAAFTQTLPFTWGTPGRLIPVGESQVDEKTAPSAFYDSVSADFFRATGIPLLSGRSFTAADDPRAPGAVIISAATAKALFGAANPVGRYLRSADPSQSAQFEIVGVVGDVKRTGLGRTETPLQIYRPLLQRPTAFASLLVQTEVRPDSVAAAVQRAIWSVDADQAIGSVDLVANLVKSSTSQQRLYLALFGAFAGIALLLSAIGLYGLVAYGVAQRTREFGIRSALGAAQRDILQLVLGDGLRLVLLGLAAGLVAAAAGVRFLQALLFATSPYDWVVFVTVPVMLGAVALTACLLPARRASQVDPVVALRAD